MGIDVTFIASLSHARKRKSAPSAEAIQQALDACRDAEPFTFDTLRDTQIVAGLDGEEVVIAVLHPAAQAIEVTADSDSVILAARTNTVGPGYHRMLYEFAPAFFERLGLTVTSIEDDTEFDKHHDYVQLQDAMLGWLSAVACSVLSQPGAESNVLSVGCGIDECWQDNSPPGVRTPIGHRSNEWLRRVSENPESGIDFFAWWDEDRNAAYWRGRALALISSEMHWTPPASSDSVHIKEETQLSLQRALEMDPDIDLPWREWLELEAQLAGEHEVPPLVAKKAALVPSSTPLMGYRRGAARWSIGAGWSVRLPRSVEVVHEDSTIFVCEEFTLHTSVMSLMGEETEQALIARRAAFLAEPRTGALEISRFEKGQVLGRILRDDHSDEEGRTTYACEASVLGQIALLTLSVPPGFDERTAMEICASLEGPPPKGEQD